MRGLAFLAALQLLSVCYVALVVVGSFDQKPSGVGRASLGDRALPAVLTARVLGGHDPQVGGQAVRFWFVSADHIAHNIGLLLEGFAAIPGGDFFGAPVTLTYLPVLTLGLLAFSAVGFVIADISRGMRTALGAPGRPITGRLAYFSFWTTSLIATTLVYAGSTAAISPGTARYLVCAYVAVAALLPAVVRGRRSRLALAAGVSVFALASIYELQSRPAEASKGPSYTATAAVVRFASAHGIHVGYAGYWDAFDLTWRSNFRLHVYPVNRCLPASPALCRHGISISSWYVPRPATPTMLIVDPANPGVAGPDPRSGRPTATARVAGMTVYLYRYDIAATLGLHRPPRPPAARPANAVALLAIAAGRLPDGREIHKNGCYPGRPSEDRCPRRTPPAGSRAQGR